jgi:glucosamine 6-phosphate synthetase-like amidotransferase/phosphosugar isomerase protein
MCGIAGYSLSESSALDRTFAAQALLAGIAERGADAVGYAHRVPAGRVSIHKQRSGASALLEQVAIPAEASDVLVHVRDYTKGHPTISANNHPIRHGAVVGVHNGIIFNDDELLAGHDCARREPGMTVDSEAIFAVAAHSDADPHALEALCGSMATAWLDERRER